MVGTRCTTWRHKPCASMTTTVCTTTISIFKIACIILLHFCRIDGRRYVPTSSAMSARCQGTCGSWHQGSQWSHQQQPLEAHPTHRSTRRHRGHTISLGNAMQARLNGRKSHKTQGKAQPSQREARIWHKLLQNLRACVNMVCNPPSHCLWHPV
jgi:hypothetical protein